MRNFLGVVVVIQGLGGFVARVFFDTDWGLLRRWWDIPTPAYLAIAAAGVALLIWSDHDRQKKES
ncbi:hypothetical protein [Nonomuraea sp. NEAU-A123]|uniref:hypothetical protein n=1 Tax=Nonomuraea sp. NEAU-A123 TaxID=2839649 RepID=UPI001BE44151|nr:hypothetical protein [Nonomuraea sp. NEAU-A123]MBT2229446.1 hypothetical protein [Nonomuraea sp. NEAU-A123]